MTQERYKENMFDIHTQTIEWAGRTLSFETGKVARQADGAVVARYGDTMILATAVGAKKVNPAFDFFPCRFITRKNICCR